jgi:SAM-dependent methyltransferase
MRNDDDLARSQVRWRGDEVDAGLTWGVIMSGQPFLDFVLAHVRPQPSGTIVEIGPGYGRITEALLRSGVPFKRYIGVELSSARVAKLRQRFIDPRMHFIEADVVAGTGLDSLSGTDLIIGSAVFEHFYPDFGRTLDHIARISARSAILVFDLVRNDETLTKADAGFEPDGGAFVRMYSLAEIRRLFLKSSFRVTALDRLSFGLGAHQQEVARTAIVAMKVHGLRRALRSLLAYVIGAYLLFLLFKKRMAQIIKRHAFAL